MITSHIFRNNELASESSEKPKKYTKRLIGGNSNIPNGGFPPIYLCIDKTHNKPEESVSKERKYESVKSVSIKSIMENRRKTETRSEKS